MNERTDRNYVSVWFWLASFLVLSIPVVNVVMAIVWACHGDNDTRKNYFRALILWFVIMTAIAISVAVMLGALSLLFVVPKGHVHQGG